MTEKWKDKWFRQLSPKYKLLWFYLLDNCDVAGIIEWDIDLWKKDLGFRFTELEIRDNFKGRVIQIPNTDYVWIPKFIEIQQRCQMDELNPENNAHKGILKAIDKYRLIELFNISLAPSEGLVSPYSNSNSKGTCNGNGTCNKDSIKFENEKLVIPNDILEKFKSEFSNELLQQEIPKMEKWLKFNKPKKDFKRFIFNWLNKGNNNGTNNNRSGNTASNRPITEAGKYDKVTQRSKE